MNRPRLCGTIGIGLLFAATAAGFAFFQRYEPGTVLHAIPRISCFSCRAENLRKLIESPVGSQIDKALGAGNSIESLLVSNTWSRLLVPAEVAVADLPGGTGTQTWVAASWIGWRSPWLRWRIGHSRHPGLSRLGTHAVWPVWRIETDGLSICFALTDKLLVASLSEDPSCLLPLLDAYDGRIPSLMQYEERTEP